MPDAPASKDLRDAESRQQTDHHAGLQRLQAAELRHPEEQGERPRPARAEEVLPVVSPPHRPPRDPVALYPRYRGGSRDTSLSDGVPRARSLRIGSLAGPSIPTPTSAPALPRSA